MQITQIFRNHRQITGGCPTRAEGNPCVVICLLFATKPVQHNQESNTPSRNCQVRHIGCICVLPDATSGLPDPRFLRSNILTLIDTTKGLKNAGSNKETSERYTRKLFIHIYKQTNTHLNTAISQLIAGALSGIQKLLKGGTNAKASFRKGIYIFTENAANFHSAVGSSIWPIRSPQHSAHRKQS